MLEKEDIRVKKSKRDLRNGLMQLLRKSPFEKLTVNEICSVAMINKMTFYKHYADKYALLDDCVNALAVDIYTKCIGSHPQDFLKGNIVDNCVKLTEEVLDECIKQREIIFMLASSNNSLNTLIVKNSIEKLVENLVVEISNLHKLKYSTKSISAFLTGGFSNLILEQLHDRGDQSVERFLNDSRQFFTDIVNNNILFT